MRLSAALRGATEVLAQAGVPSPRRDAEELAACHLHVERQDLWRREEIDDGYDVLVARRAAREPLQHITGRAYFRHLVLAVGPGVFVPRPETEVVAGQAIEYARALAQPVVVDLGTGTGAIAVSVATEVPSAQVHAVEVDPAAYAWAQRNCLGTGVDLRLGDLRTAFPDLDGRVDVVVSNPPYIPMGAHIRDPEVVEFDPPVALWSGPDGLDAMIAVQASASRLLRPGGRLVVEHADLQGQAVPDLLHAARGWADVADHADLAGRPRFTTAVRD